MDKRLILMIVFTLIFTLFSLTDYTADDYLYQFIYQGEYPTEETSKLRSPLDIPFSMVNHSRHQNGRLLSHGLLQLLMLFPKWVFNLLSTLVFLAMGFYLYKNAWLESQPRALSYAIIYPSLFIFLPQFGQSVLWMSGSLNYLWTSCFALAYTYYYRVLGVRRDNRLSYIILPILSVLIGLTNENGGGAVFLFTVLYLIVKLCSKKRVRPIQAISSPLILLGLYLQLNLPINQTRMSGAFSLDEILDWKLAYMLKVTWDTSGVLYLVYGFLFIYALREKVKTQESLVYLIAGTASALVMIFTPNLSHRSWIWTVVFCLVAIAILAKELRISPSILRVLAFGLIIVAGLTYMPAFQSIFQTHREILLMEEDIKEQRSLGIRNVRVRKFVQPTNPYNAMTASANLRAEKNAWSNQWQALYYGVDSISITNPEEVWDP